jgi:glycosyltransferase involved in cell wall biosynthesis
MFIAPSAYPLGGVQVWLDYIVEGLSERGHEVFVGLTSGRFHDVDRYLHGHPFTNVVRIESTTGTAEGRIRSLTREIANIEPDMVLAVNIADVYPAVARLRKSGMNIRVVMTLHGIQADFLEDVQRYKNVLDGVVCTNRLVSTLLAATGFAIDRVKYAPYGVGFERHTIAREFAANGALRIAYVGRYDQDQKRVLDIVEIFRQLTTRNVRYKARFAGDGPLSDELQLALAAETDAGNVSFLGVLTPEAVERNMYGWADVLLVTSSWETGPIVIWEAMSRGVPVVTSEYVGSIAEGSLVNGKNCLMFPIGDCSQAVDRIMALKNSSFQQAIVENGFMLVEARYSKQASINSWSTAIDEVLELPISKVDSYMRPAPSGRLDRTFGVELAESLRQVSGRNFLHKSPGSEWPHSHSHAPTDQEFLARVAYSEVQQFKARGTII